MNLSGRRDLLLAVSLVAAAELELALTGGISSGARVVSAVAGAVFVLLADARRRPRGVLLAIVLVVLAQAAVGGGLLRGLCPLVGVAIAALALGARVRTRPAVVAGALAAVGLTLANQLDAATGFGALNDLVFFGGLVIAGPIAIGHVLGTRATQIAQLRERTEQLARDEDIALAALRAEERSRLARDVHAAIAQRVGEIALQAGGAERVASSDGVRALEALGRVEATARASLEELREIIGVLRETNVRA